MTKPNIFTNNIVLETIKTKRAAMLVECPNCGSRGFMHYWFFNKSQDNDYLCKRCETDFDSNELPDYITL